MMQSEQKQKILDFARTQILGVLASVNEGGEPQAALVAITETDDFEFIFGTYNTSRKYKNIRANPHVAFVLGNDIDERITVQVEGKATELAGEEADRYRDIHIKKNPRSKKYATKPEQRWFIIKPTWARYTNLNTDPQEQFEIHLTS